MHLTISLILAINSINRVHCEVKVIARNATTDWVYLPFTAAVVVTSNCSSMPLPTYEHRSLIYSQQICFNHMVVPRQVRRLGLAKLIWGMRQYRCRYWCVLSLTANNIVAKRLHSLEKAIISWTYIPNRLKQWHALKYSKNSTCAHKLLRLSTEKNV